MKSRLLKLKNKCNSSPMYGSKDFKDKNWRSFCTSPPVFCAPLKSEATAMRQPHNIPEIILPPSGERR